MESLKNAKCVLESPCKVLEVFIQKRVRTLYITHNTTEFYLTEGQNLDAMCQFTDRCIH